MQQQIPDIAVFGVPGAGKGTQVKQISQANNGPFVHLGMSDALRALIASDPTKYGYVAPIMASGRLAPDEVIMPAVNKFVRETALTTPVVFDGIPRKWEQMIGLNKIEKQMGRTLHIVELVLSDEEAMKRIAERAKNDGRADDQKREVVEERVQIFHRETKPLIDEYRRLGYTVVSVDSFGTIEEVSNEFCAAVGLIRTVTGDQVRVVMASRQN